MHQKTTPDDLILYYYNETQLTKTVIIQKAIDTDEETAACFEHIKNAAALLNNLLESPSEDCLKRVMAYASLHPVM